MIEIDFEVKPTSPPYISNPYISNRPDVLARESRRSAWMMKKGDLSSAGRKAVLYLSQYGSTDEEYLMLRDKLFDEALGKDPQAKKYVASLIGKLTVLGLDDELEKKLSAIIKRVIRRKEQTGGLDKEQQLALRVIFQTPGSKNYNILIQLLTAEQLDPRLKKLIFRKIKNNHYTTDLFSSQQIRNIVHTDSRQTQWRSFRTIAAILALSSNNVRDKAIFQAQNVLLYGRKNLNQLTEIYDQKGPQIPPELFLNIYLMSKTSEIPIEKFNEFFQKNTPNRQLTEEILHLSIGLLELTNYNIGRLSCRGWLIRCLWDQEVSEGSLSILVSCLRKLLSLKQSEDKQEILIKKLFNKEKEDMLTKKDKPLNLQYIDQFLTDEIIGFLNELSSIKIEKPTVERMLDMWGDIDPFVSYISKLKERRDSNKVKLMMKALSQIDAPDLDKWKKWRYNMSNPIVRKQIGSLSRSAKEAYIRDYVAYPGEIVCETNLKDKLIELKSLLVNNLLSSPKDQRSIKILADFFNNVDIYKLTKLIEEKLKKTNDKLEILASFTELTDNLSTAHKVHQILENWKKAEAKKEKTLKNNDFERLSAEQIEKLPNQLEVKIANLMKSEIMKEYQNLKKRMEYLKSKNQTLSNDEELKIRQIKDKLAFELGDNYEERIEAYKKITLLKNSSPKPLDQKTASWLLKYCLTETSSEQEIESKTKFILKRFNLLLSSQNFQKISQEFNLSSSPKDQEVYSLIKDLKVVSDLLNLSIITPKLAFGNKLSDMEQSGSLSQALLKLIKTFSGDEIGTVLREMKNLFDAQTISDNEDLLFVFTDNPLIGINVGRYPKGAESCQKYWYGEEALAAYVVDAMTKFCLLVDKSQLNPEISNELNQATEDAQKLQIFNKNPYAFLEALIARRIIKIVETDNKSPAMFLEPLYTSYNINLMTEHLNRFALHFLKPKIGLKLIKGAGNGGLGIRNGKKVKVPNSRAGAQYEDGATGGPNNGGLGTKTGSYTMAYQELSEADF